MRRAAKSVLLLLAAGALFVACQNPTLPDKVSKITLTASTTSLVIAADGTSNYATIEASVEPATATDPSVTWTVTPAAGVVQLVPSSPPGSAIAVVTPVATGTAVITATSNDGTSVVSNDITITVP
jgi:uncharacterized protein YjdB